MKYLTGSYKKTTAGLVCVLSMVFVLSAAPVTAASLANTVPSSADVAAQPVMNAATQPVTNSLTNAPLAANPINKSAAPLTGTNSASQVASLLGGLALILILIYGLSWFVKRFSQGGFMQNPSMKIVSAMPLGTRERLMLVDVGGKQLLLGVTATQINTLHVFDEPVVANEKSQPIASEFSHKLMAILQQKNIVSPDTEIAKK